MQNFTKHLILLVLLVAAAATGARAETTVDLSTLMDNAIYVAKDGDVLTGTPTANAQSASPVVPL